MKERIQEIPKDVANFYNSYKNKPPKIIQDRYAELARRYHPNKNPNNKKEIMTATFQEIGSARNRIHEYRRRNRLTPVFREEVVYYNKNGYVLTKNEKERRESLPGHPGFRYRKRINRRGHAKEIWKEWEPLQSRPVIDNLSPRGSSTRQNSAVHGFMTRQFGIQFNRRSASPRTGLSTSRRGTASSQSSGTASTTGKSS